MKTKTLVVMLLLWPSLCGKLVAKDIVLSSSDGDVTARWNAETTDWSKNPHPVLGDWGFNRPGYPAGLYIHGITVKDGKKVKNPVIYDNDVYDDVFDDEWMYCMASQGKLNLAALICTPVLTDGWDFSHPDWIPTALDSRSMALASGIPEKVLPPITVGTEADSEKAGERKDSEGARLYVRLINENYRKHPDRPLIVNIGGQSATLASAYCLDPSIAEKCIVYYTDVRVYNGHYEWASKLVAKHFRIISFGDDFWWKCKASYEEWNVLPRPNEWHLLTDMHKPMLDHIVHQFKNRGEYSKEGVHGDGYCDGAFMHAWIPQMFPEARLMEVRGEETEAIHITRFTPVEEAAVKKQALETLLNPKSYKKVNSAK